MILANITVPLAGLVDAAMLGHLDEARHLAGVALGSVAFDYIFWTFGFLRMATTGLTAQSVGRADLLEADRTGLRAMWMGLGIGLCLVLLSPVLGALSFALLEGEAAVQESGRAYFDMRILGAPATLANFAITGWLLGRGEGRAVLVVASIGNTVNIVLDYVFIYQLGWLAAGAGAATALASLVSFGVGMIWVLPALSSHGRQVHQGLWEPVGLRSLMSLNGAIVIRTLALVSAFSLFLDFSAVMGTAVLAANALLLKVLSLASWFIDGMAFAVEGMVGQFKGARDGGAARQLLRLGVRDAVLTGLVVAAVCTLFPGIFVVLTDQPALLSRLAMDAPWLFGLLGFGAIAYILDGWFLGISAGKQMRDAMLISFVIGFLPLALAARWVGSPWLLWLALVVFMAARVLTLGRHVRWSLAQIEA